MENKGSRLYQKITQKNVEERRSFDKAKTSGKLTEKQKYILTGYKNLGMGLLVPLAPQIIGQLYSSLTEVKTEVVLPPFLEQLGLGIFYLFFSLVFSFTIALMITFCMMRVHDGLNDYEFKHISKAATLSIFLFIWATSLVMFLFYGG